ncbi:MAG: hypothetical protein KH135_07075 [Firmicutes bacterium]|nr:hypothetical protein [Bacillota bacterium]
MKVKISRSQKIWLILAISFWVIVCIIGIVNPENKDYKTDDIQSNQQRENKPMQEDNKNEKTNIETQQNPVINTSNYDIEISTKEMSEIYYNNELNGNKQFFGKRIKTQVIFDETSNGSLSGLIAYFKGIDSIYNIHCTSFTEETKSDLSTLNRNEMVNVIGEVDELIGSSIKFKDCKIYK